MTPKPRGALPELFGGIRAPSTSGTFLRGFTWGNVRQLDAVARETLVGLSRHAPLLPGADSYAFLDADSTIKRAYGYDKQGADYGYTRVRGLHPLLATLSTPIAAAVIVGTRLRQGSAGSAKGAAGFVAEAISTARAAGATGVLLARMDSAVKLILFRGELGIAATACLHCRGLRRRIGPLHRPRNTRPHLHIV